MSFRVLFVGVALAFGACSPQAPAPVADILKPAPFSLDALSAEVRVAVSRARQADDVAKANAAHDGLGVEWTQDGKVAQAGLWKEGGLAN
jgi:hypothetical protein